MAQALQRKTRELLATGEEGCGGARAGLLARGSTPPCRGPRAREGWPMAGGRFRSSAVPVQWWVAVELLYCALAFISKNK